MDEATLEFIRTHRTLQVSVSDLLLRAGRYPRVDMAAAAVQVRGWQVAYAKVPAYAAVDGLHYPPHLSLEQCSSEVSARYKVELCRRLGEHALVDLTGGFGVDFSFMAQAFERAVYVEQQALLCDLARHNFPLLGLGKGVEVVCADAETFVREGRVPERAIVFLDPARRDRMGGRVVALSDCVPDVRMLMPLLRERARNIVLKLSPMLDISALHQELQGYVSEVHVVAAGGECKELLVVSGGERQALSDVPHYVVEVDAAACGGFHFTRGGEQEAMPSYALPKLDNPLYLYDAHVGLRKAGAYKLPAVRYGMEKLSVGSHLYLSHQWQPEFPGRCFWVEDYGGFGKQDLRRLLTGLKQANLAVRGFPATVAELRKRLRLREGGDRYFFAATAPDGRHILLRGRKVVSGR